MKGKIARRQFVESLSLGAVAFAGALTGSGTEAADNSPSQMSKPGQGGGPSEGSSLARSERPFFETFPLKFRQKPVVGGKPVIYGQGPFAYASIPSITRTPGGRLFLTWCASIGFARGDRVVGSYSSDGGRTWDAPIELIDNPDRDDADPVIVVDGQRLMVISTSGRLPEKVDKFNPWPVKYDRTWWYMTSTEDGGKSWGKPVVVKRPHVYAGKRSNGYQLKNGTLVLPYYFLPAADQGNVPHYESDMHSVAAMARSTDRGLTWTSGQAVEISGSKDGADEPATVLLSSGEIFCLLRNSLDHLYEMRSQDGGMTWDAPRPSPLPAYNAPAWLHRLEGRPGDELVVGWDYLAPWANSVQRGRHPLVVAHSPDGGRSWSRPKMLSDPNPMEGFRADYPTICQTKDGLIVVVWQQETLPHHLGKELRVARFNRAWLVQ